jgi:methylated-DNA-[protein]-cysteine S-methyltransferase
MKQEIFETPVGPLYLVASEKGLRGLCWKNKNTQSAPGRAAEEILRDTRAQLAEYFRGKRTAFDLPLDMDGTEFQLQVWRELQKIPYGKTISYRELATRVRNPKACRAVGTANGRNPVPIIVPCHRVIAADGTLGGYTGGLMIKTKLLDLEKR